MFGAVKLLVIFLQLSYIHSEWTILDDDETIIVWDDEPIDSEASDIRKREADFEEGSGDGLPPIVIGDIQVTPLENESQNTQTQLDNKLSTSTVIPEASQTSQSSPKLLESTQNAPENSKSVGSSTQQPLEQSSSVTQPEPAIESNSTPQKNNDPDVLPTEKSVDNQNIPSSTQKLDESVSSTTEIAPKEGKKGRRLLPSHGAVEKESPSEENKTEENTNKEKEPIDEKQSGNSVLNEKEVENKAEGIHETEKTLDKLQTNSENSQPETGESSSDIKKSAAKDTTILFLLFGAVLLVFALGFTYSFIKRKKERKQNKRMANDINIIRKSLQSLTTAQSNGGKSEDIEQGTEMKPLMKIPEEQVKVSNENEKH